MLFLLYILVSVQAQCELPNMSVGDFNLTSEKQLKDVMKKEKSFLIGLSASWCEECCKREPLYKKLVEKLELYRPRIPFIRIDAAKSPFIKKYLGDHDTVPQIVGVRNGVIYRYLDLMNIDKIFKFADKLYAPVKYIENLSDAQNFLSKPTGKFDTLRVLGVFYDSDLIEEFQKAVEPFCNWFSADFRMVTQKSLVKELKAARPEIQYLNGVVVLRGDEVKVLDLEVPQDIFIWVLRNSIGLVDEITPYNFQMYEANRMPIIIMFLDPNNIHTSSYIDLYTKSARNFDDKVKFTWADGTSEEYLLKRRKLGLVTEILPSIAFNLGTKDIYPYPESEEITEEKLEKFVQGFLDGKKYPPQPKISSKNSLMDNCASISREEFDEKVLTEGYDAVFLVYSTFNNKESAAIAPVFNKICKRFKELEYPYLRVYVIDISTQPVHKTVRIDRVPIVYMVPAYSKSPPFVHYSGKGEILPIMFFIEKYAGVKFTLPELPHLSPDEAEEYWEAKEKLSKEQQEQVARDNERREYF